MMLPARPNRLVMSWFDGWCRRAIRRAFWRLHLYGPQANTFEQFDASRPRLYVANHCSFWDGVVLNHLLRGFRRGQRLYCMIDLVQVRKHWFFTRVGGFSIDRSSPRSAVQSLVYTAGLLDGGSAVVMFPQGAIRPSDRRPLAFERGVLRLLDRVDRLEVVPLALRYEFWEEQRAEAMVWCGSPMENTGSIHDRDQRLRRLEESVSLGLDALIEAGKAHRQGRVILQGRRSISHWSEQWQR